jgi:hypothetical protein
MTRGNQREQARAKNQAKQQDKLKAQGKVSRMVLNSYNDCNTFLFWY